MEPFKLWLENEAINIPVGKLYGWSVKLSSAIQEVKDGKISYSNESPIIVSRLDNPRGSFYVLDGYHRLIEAIMAGQTFIIGQIDEHTPRIERTGGAYSEHLTEKLRIIDFVK